MPGLQGFGIGRTRSEDWPDLLGPFPVFMAGAKDARHAGNAGKKGLPGLNRSRMHGT